MSNAENDSHLTNIYAAASNVQFSAKRAAAATTSGTVPKAVLRAVNRNAPVGAGGPPRVYRYIQNVNPVRHPSGKGQELQQPVTGVRPTIGDRSRQYGKAAKKVASEATAAGYWRHNATKPPTQHTQPPQSTGVHYLYTASTIATGRRSRHTSQSSASIHTTTSCSRNPEKSSSSSSASSATAQPVNLNDYEYPAFSRIQRNEPKCAHIKRIDRNQSIGHGYILALQTPAIRASLNTHMSAAALPMATNAQGASPLTAAAATAAALGTLFNDNFTLFCLDCCSRYSTIDELSYKVRNYHVCNNQASEQFNQKCPSVLFLEKQTLGIYCAECNRFLLQDNKQDDLRAIRMLTQTQLGLMPSLNLRKLHQWSVCYSRLNTLRRALRAFREGSRQMKIERVNRRIPTAFVRYKPLAVTPSEGVRRALRTPSPLLHRSPAKTPDLVDLAVISPHLSPMTVVASPPTVKTPVKLEKFASPPRAAPVIRTPLNSPKTGAGGSSSSPSRVTRKRQRASPIRTTTERIKVYDPRGIISRKLPDPLEPSQIQNDPTTYLSTRRSNPDKTPSPQSNSGSTPKLTSRQQAKSNNSSPPTPDRSDVSAAELANQEKSFLYLTRGLKNLGNTCYMNTVVQALSYLPRLVNAFVRNRVDWATASAQLETSLLNSAEGAAPTAEEEELVNFGPNPLEISKALHSIMNRLRYVSGILCEDELATQKTSNATSSVHNPTEFMKTIRTFTNFETPHEQHDAHEFLVKLIDSQINCRDTYSYPSALRYSRRGAENAKQIAKVFNKIFMGELTQITTCLCCHSVHHTTETLQTLTVTIEQTNIDFQQQDTIPAYLLDDLHEVRKYNLRKRNTSKDSDESEQPLPAPQEESEARRKAKCGKKAQQRGNKRGTASKRAAVKASASSAKSVAVGEAKLVAHGKRRKLESPISGASISTNSSSTTGQPLILPLESLLDDFFKQESLDVYCQKCYEEMKETRPGNTNQLPIHKVKQYQISRLPAAFILHINRSKYKAGYGGVIKDSTPVEILQRLDFRPYCRKSNYFSRPHVTQYQLSAVIVHDGRSISSGHYRVYCLNYAKQQWLHINDSKIKAYNFEDIAAYEKEPYLLFYSKCTDYSP